MTTKTAYIISLKFAPGLKKEFVLLGESLRKLNIDVKYLLAEEYQKLQPDNEAAEYIISSGGNRRIFFETLRHLNKKMIIEIIARKPPVFILFYNPHPLNPFVARLIKKRFAEAKLALYLHDPYKPDKREYGIVKMLYINFVEFIQRRTVTYMDYVISPSQYSSKLFIKHYPEFKGETYTAPLLVPDQNDSGDNSRKYFSIVGTVHLATGHDTFVSLINYIAEKGGDYKFVLITSSNIANSLKKLNNQARNILKIINKNIISDSEINEIIRESYAVFRLDREVTQSGVIPVSYMNGTPVIVRDIPGLTQHVKHMKNGYIIPGDCSLEDLENSMSYTMQNFHYMSECARNSYEETWAEMNWHRYYSWLEKTLI